MHLASDTPRDDYLHGPRSAWFAFAMTIALMLFDYIDRQVIVSLFPHIKAEWQLSDKQLGALVSIVSVTVALGTVPVAFVADRTSRVKGIFAMAATWSLACMGCMLTRNFGQLLTARALVGAGEAGYGAVGAALIASHFPSRMRGALLAAFFAAASVGSVLGVVLGGAIAARFGWQAAFGVVGIPGAVLALLYLWVRDYPTVPLSGPHRQAAATPAGVLRYLLHTLTHNRTVLWVCIGGAAQLIVVSSVWSWLPSYLHRFQGVATEQAALQAALAVLASALGSVVWGAVADRMGLRRPLHKLFAMAFLCGLSMLILMGAFGMTAWSRLPMTGGLQNSLVVLGAFVMTCTVGPVSAIVIDVVHPAVRSTGSSVLSLFQNLFGLAAGPFLTGALSDALGLQVALALVPLASVLAMGALVKAAASYEADMARVRAA